MILRIPSAPFEKAEAEYEALAHYNGEVKATAVLKCEARTAGGFRCSRRAQWEGLCFQHWRTERKGGHVDRAYR